MTHSVNPVLDAYAKGKINSINIDTDFEKISVGISNKDHLIPVEIIFEDVKAFYYIDHDLKNELDISNENLNIISYDDLGFGEFATVKTNSDEDIFVSIPNFAVNLNDSSLYIDAHKIRINNKAFSVR
ncbi:YxiG family protein [Fusibacter tunisiensis]|jgi:hypothetical protein|uniref:Uncharacterized protein n=1 Tax=Fusibacter tunisiensis TaxID=1008308 RepID=A0ABS2MPA9_9FIRM|nr:hypothetical protein [Fusibacter tunisiensis]MBM7561224.1 hypothetical protein [Fusibacter tunisiensis]